MKINKIIYRILKARLHLGLGISFVSSVASVPRISLSQTIVKLSTAHSHRTRATAKARDVNGLKGPFTSLAFAVARVLCEWAVLSFPMVLDREILGTEATEETPRPRCKRAFIHIS